MPAAIPRVFSFVKSPRDRRRLDYLANKYTRQYRPYLYSLSGEYSAGVYIPDPSQILSYPNAGSWYRLVTGDTYWGISKAAYGSDNIKAGLFLMNDALWNSHIDKKTKNWEAYGVSGLQATPDYSAVNPHAPKGSGNDYPTVWIPPMTGEEPEDLYPEPVISPEPSPIVGPQGPPGPAGPQGEPGPIGPAGPAGAQGPAGPPPTDEVIKKRIRDYLIANPPAPGAQGPIGPQGPAGPPGKATPEQIRKAVQKYLIAHPPPAGPIGPSGPIGPQGPIGPSGKASDRGMWILQMIALLSSL